MAGAVSAGAYTAGVIDYLLETLELWEQAKRKNQSIKEKYPDRYLHHGYDESVPTHEVQLEVLSGASAGGITGTLTLLSLLEKRANAKPNYKLYQAWVDMADDEQEDTLSKMLTNTDIEKYGEVRSLLNSLPIEEIADKALDLKTIGQFPPYVSPNLDLVLTISNLNGIQYRIKFKGTDDDAGTVITNHAGFYRYRIANETLQSGVPEGEGLYYVLNLREGKDRNYLKFASLSTSAFPIGLEPRDGSVDQEYIERYSKYLFAERENVEVQNINQEKDFKFVAVDGGLINNEPFGFALKILKEKYQGIEETGEYAMIMINPFPNYRDEPDIIKKDLLSIARNVFVTLRHQVMFKQDDILKAIDDTNSTQFLIAPVGREIKHKNGREKISNALACGALAGFSGFLSKDFREHDFKLGRQNCQSFLRYHFAIPLEEVENKLHIKANEFLIDRFSFTIPPQKKGGKKFFPIIPDMKVLRAFDEQFDIVNYGAAAKLAYPELPNFSMDQFKAKYSKQIKSRINIIIKSYVKHKLARMALTTWGTKRVYNRLMDLIEDALKKGGLI